MSSKNKCHICNKKVPSYLVDTNVLKCRCDNVCCSLHIHQHNCTFDYTEEHKAKISKLLPKVKSSKIILI